ncbi:unnamed protein product [Closterium sp. Naga37s-1]|nr:unnamed protein product [Closterium sp. Naga37s-1]
MAQMFMAPLVLFPPTKHMDILIREGVLQEGGMAQSHGEVERGVVEGAYWEMVKQDIATAAASLEELFHKSNGESESAYREYREAESHGEVERGVVEENAYREMARQDNTTAAASLGELLIFSLTRYGEVMEAYVAGLEDAVAAANVAADALPRVNLSFVASVASFFISRVDSAVDKRLKAIGTEEALALLGKAALAQTVVAYDMFKTKFSGPRWEALEQLGARVQRPLWASTGVKDPSYPDTIYIDALIGPHSVNTIPDATLLAFADHGEVKRTVDADVDAAYAVLDRLKAVGVDMEEVAQVRYIPTIAKRTAEHTLTRMGAWVYGF